MTGGQNWADKYQSVHEGGGMLLSRTEGPSRLQGLSRDWRLRQKTVLLHSEILSSLNADPVLVLEVTPRDKETELYSKVQY